MSNDVMYIAKGQMWKAWIWAGSLITQILIYNKTMVGSGKVKKANNLKLLIEQDFCEDAKTM